MASHDDEIIHRQLDGVDPVIEVAETIAQLRGESVDRLGPLYDTVDHVIDELYSDPPADEAQMEVTFTYEGYRITMDQFGTAEFVEVG